MSVLRDWFTAAYNLTSEQKRKAVRVVLWVAGLILVLTVALLARTASSEVGADNPFWELVIKARLDLFEAVGDVGRSILAVFIALAEFQALDNSSLGKRMWVWTSDSDGNFLESEEVKKAKKQNAALVFIGLLLLNALIFGVGR